MKWGNEPPWATRWQVLCKSRHHWRQRRGQDIHSTEICSRLFLRKHCQLGWRLVSTKCWTYNSKVRDQSLVIHVTLSSMYMVNCFKYILYLPEYNHISVLLLRFDARWTCCLQYYILCQLKHLGVLNLYHPFQIFTL